MHDIIACRNVLSWAKLYYMKAFLFFVLGFARCQPLALHPDAELVETTTAAINCINKAANKKLVELDTGIDGMRVFYAPLRSERCGEYDDYYNYIKLDADNCREPTQNTLVHEIGHVLLGPKHTDTPTVMSGAGILMSQSEACASLAELVQGRSGIPPRLAQE